MAGAAKIGGEHKYVLKAHIGIGLAVLSLTAAAGALVGTTRTERWDMMVKRSRAALRILAARC